MNIVVTGAAGFIGKNLCLKLQEHGFHNVIQINRKTPKKNVHLHLSNADFIFHLAASNRPDDELEFQTQNVDLTNFVVDTLIECGRYVPIVLTSSTQVDQDNLYGQSKLVSEEIVKRYSKNTGAPCYIYRLPNVFGKWCRPNYNSFVATFCHNIMNNIDILIHDKNAKVELVYIDDVCESLLGALFKKHKAGFVNIGIEYSTTVGKVAEIISSFKSSQGSLVIERVGAGLTRALYSTFLSYTPPEKFSHSLPSYADDRGVFCEMLKTKDSGQISFFTAHPGVTRGGHYHHTKNEKFLVVRGSALFKFENMANGEVTKLTVTGAKYECVATIPGWAHSITNVGEDELIVMLWANETFDPKRSDTIAKLL